MKGTQTIRVEYKPDEIVKHVRKNSPALNQRYGIKFSMIEKTERFERNDPEKDSYPERKTITETLPWDTYYAKEAEWTGYFTGDEKTASTDVTIMSHDPDEEAYPYGIWEYNQISGGYEIEAPMNVISEEPLSDVLYVFASDGWWLDILQDTRWAWNSDTNTFDPQHDEAASHPDGILGRQHVRFWEFGGYVSGSAHVDSSIPHHATSFDEAEQEVEDVFDRNPDWEGIEDYYDLDNGGLDDHDGYATDLWHWND